MSFLLHATDEQGLINILSDQKLKINPKKPRMISNPNRIFFQWLHPDTIPYRTHAQFWGPYALVFRENILKNTKGTYGPIGSFDKPKISKRFNGMLKQSQKDNIRRLCQGPNFLPKSIRYMHSHEITVENNVSLDYLVAVVSLESKFPFDIKKYPNISFIKAKDKTFLQLLKALSKNVL